MSKLAYWRAAIAGLGIATIFTGGAAGVILGAAFYGAVIEGAVGAISGGWDGFLEGASSGFMVEPLELKHQELILQLEELKLLD